MVAIREVESTNNYSIVNPDSGALGAYQVMPYHLKDWGQQVFGRTLTKQEFLSNPGMQDQMASAILGGYYDKYGFDGAAAMWFSGQSNPYSTRSDGGNTVQQYVNKARKVLGMPTLSGQPQTSSGVSTSKGGSVAKTQTPVPTIDPNVLAQQYGYAAALFNSEPELKNLFARAVKEGWTADRFQAGLANTTWWKTHSKTQRDYILKSFNDPASFKQDKDNMAFKINELGAQLGVTGLMNTVDLDNLSFEAVKNGWSDAELKYHLANLVHMSPEGVLGGQGGQFQQKMASLGWANGVRLDQNWYLNYYKGILQGTTSEEQAQAWIRNQAAAIFPAFRDQIMAGANVMDIANPYIQSMGNILEVNAGDLDLFDKDIIGALNYKDPKTGTTGAKPLWQWEVDLRKDPRWLQTNNAREGMMGVAHKVAQDFGVLF